MLVNSEGALITNNPRWGQGQGQHKTRIELANTWQKLVVCRHGRKLDPKTWELIRHILSVALFTAYREGGPTNTLENHIHRNLYESEIGTLQKALLKVPSN